MKGEILLESYNSQTGHTYIAGPKQEGMSFSGMIELKFLKVCRIKSIKGIKIFFLFHFRILNFFKKEKKDKMTQDIATVKNYKKEEN